MLLKPLIFTQILLSIQIAYVDSHGFLFEPAGRASAWRKHFKTPEDYDDDGLFCGGHNSFWELNNGKCGVCGDAFEAQHPRPHEVGGRYVTRPPTITATYEQGDIIDVMVNLTANHGGFFVFQLCPADDPLQEVDEDCLNDNNLEIVREQPVDDSVANSIESNLGVLTRAERNESEAVNGGWNESKAVNGQQNETKTANGQRNENKTTNGQRNESEAVNGQRNESQAMNGQRNENKTTNGERNDIDDSSLLTNLTDSSYESFDSLEATGELNNTGNAGDLVNDEFGNVGQGSGEVGNEIDLHLETNMSLLIKTVRRYNLFNPVDLDDHTYDRFKYPVPFESPRSYTIKVKLSNEISCERCVLRWIYVTGNTWDFSQKGIGRTGNGKQEEFRNCADIRIH